MKTLNELINDYTCHLQQGELQLAYKGILDFIGKLRSAFIRSYRYYDVSGIYQGYMDMSYFSLSTKSLKDKELKIAVVYLHNKCDFEVWLSARNRGVAKSYLSFINSNITDNLNVFHDPNNPDAILEYILSSSPNFEDQELLITVIKQGVEQFESAVSNFLQIEIKSD